ncbi:uncharacterized protein si:dkey-52l18.4 isoform X2 [Pungitius pungitius]|uniref:uncharacterized protein si:dkey-52l18.4 isoform X2 n=1 Tax=Pungitius pungitius TaxID=134920 RepID=UPI002E11DBDA
MNPLSQSDMHYRLLGAIGCLCLLHPGLWAEECSQDVLGKRENVTVPAGQSLSLSCVVQHCGGAWTGTWTIQRTDSKGDNITARRRLSNVSLSATQTRLTLDFPSVGLLDEGTYGCSVKWAQGDTRGHLMYVNVTAAVPSERSVLHRVLVCAGASLCLPIVLCLALCLRSEVEPRSLPRTLSTHSVVYRKQPQSAPRPPPRCPVLQKPSTSSHKAFSESTQKNEVVYADISQHALGQRGAVEEPDPSTTYSALMFS